MKFEDMKKIWDEQAQEQVYAINEEKLHDNIRSRKRSTSQLVNRIELFLIGVNGFVGAGLLTLNVIDREKGLFYGLALGIVLMAMAVLIVIWRNRRLKDEKKFDRTMLGDLEHAISNATYQARLSHVMLLMVIPVFAFTILAAWLEQKPIEVLAVIALLFVAATVLGRWEHRSIHVKRKKRLVAMRDMLVG
ncbi:MAG: hypothetical protein RIB47_09000 [Cyclobacteriaceae bacterium]